MSWILSLDFIFHNSLVDSYMEVARFSHETARNAVELEDLARKMNLDITVEEMLAGFGALMRLTRS